MCWDLDFLAILAEYVAGVAKKQQRMLWGSLKKVSDGEQVEKFIFFEFLTCFWPFLTGVLPFQKKLGQTVRKNKLKPKSYFSHSKVDCLFVFHRRLCQARMFPTCLCRGIINCDMPWGYIELLFGTSWLRLYGEEQLRGHSLFRFCWTCRCMPLHVPYRFLESFSRTYLYPHSPITGIDLLGWCPTHQSLSLCQMWFFDEKSCVVVQYQVVL